MPITEKYILMCDDIRREDNGKFLLVGMYLVDMSIPAIPFPLPTLTFLAALDSDRPGTFRFSFTLTHEETRRKIAEGMGQAPVIDPTQPMFMPIKIGGLRLEAVGAYSFALQFEGQAPMVRTFNVILSIPGAAPPGLPQNYR